MLTGRRGVGAVVRGLLGAAALPALLTGPAQAGPPTRFAQAWSRFKDRFVLPDGRVADGANRGISHTEGQGYGMLIAVAADDRAAFARLWGWTRAKLYRRPDGLGSWRWEPDASPHLTDTNNATDGDILVAWALLRAGARWRSPDYADFGRGIARAVGRGGLFPSRFGLAIRPAVAGFGNADMKDGPVVNLSYWVFPALQAFAAAVPEFDWGAVIRSGLAILDAARFGPDGLPADWISVQDRPKPAINFRPLFSYDAIRIPLYLVWSGLEDRYRLSSFLTFSADPSIIDVETGKRSESFSDAGYRTIFDLVECSHGHPRFSDDGLERLSDAQPYYPSALQLLAWMAAEDRGLSCG